MANGGEGGEAGFEKTVQVSAPKADAYGYQRREGNPFRRRGETCAKAGIRLDFPLRIPENAPLDGN